MKYDLTKPCDLCPFRNDEKRLYVPPARLAEFVQGEFCCHKTGESSDESGGIEPTEKSQHCAGALILLEKIGRPHQMMRICERLGMYDASKLDMDAPVFGSFSEVQRAERKTAKRKTPEPPSPPKDDATKAPDSGLAVIADSLKAFSPGVQR